MKCHFYQMKKIMAANLTVEHLDVLLLIKLIMIIIFYRCKQAV